ncbi:cell division control protein 6 homolog [Aricia agestis]|uniref:cell division control protein 6 homolog n=1 Tax=Aricia agestis TaxID=91739 RepID=UPI001C20BBCE|nr:cell division control protein 6 homolog [Aricia agestis]XP_041978276.1 cell division control protein 6 homolog [Aricia agestis]
MSSCQTEIPFRSRKRTYLQSKKEKCNIENKDILNIVKTVKKSLKRINEDKLEKIVNDDVCSAKKIAKPLEVSDDCGKDSDTANSFDTNENSLKPLVSRENEIAFLENFLYEHLESDQSGSLYISGQPGTGKTASLSYVLKLPKVKYGYQQVYVNCTMMKSASSIYNRICKELRIKTSGTSEKASLSAIEKFLCTDHKMILLVLDEIDQLGSARQSVLYTLFGWAAVAAHRTVLVGVANALDLTERALPRLAARGLRPATLHFAPYTKQQIVDVFTSVLADEDKGNVFSPVALQMLAAKISAISGDMRRALDIGRRVIELARRSKFAETQCVETMMKDNTATVELKQVLQVLNDVYGGSAKIDNDVEESLPLQQKLILCSLILILNKGNTKEIQMGKLHDEYKKVCAARNICPLELGELGTACALLEARGALTVRAAGNGGARGRRLRLQWDESELRAALRDKPLLAAILQRAH